MIAPAARAAILCIAALSLLAACSDEPGEDRRASADVVHVFNWSDYIGETTIEEFTAATGIRVVYDVMDSNEVLEAKLLAGRSGYDVVVPTSQPFFARQIAAGVYQKLDRDKIPNLANLDADLMAQVRTADPGNDYGVIYQWGTTGIGYNLEKLNEHLPAPPVGSLMIVFDPDIISRVAPCGVALLDSPSDIFPLVLHYLGKDPNSQNPDDLAAAEAHLLKIRPYIRTFHSSQYINDLANGDICLAIGWSGDIVQARMRAEEAGRGVSVDYAIPREGTMLWFDMLAIPADAPHPDAAHAFINFVLEPEVMAGITNHVAYANAVPASLPYVDEAIRNDPEIFPPDEVKAKLFAIGPVSAEYERQRTRAWTRVRTGR